MLNKVKKFISSNEQSLIDLWALIVSFFSALLIAPIFKLPFANPYNISNPYNTIGLNPGNNFIVVIAVIILTPIIFYCLQWLYASRYQWVTKVIVACVFAGYYFATTLLTTHAGSSLGPGDLNVFHVGEQLSPAYAFLHGQRLYTQIVFLRGAGVDVLFPAAGLLAFGQSLGSYMIMNDICRLTALFSFAALLALIFKNPLKYTAVLLFFFAAANTSIVEFRDTFVWIAFALVMFAFKRNISDRTRKVSLCGLGVVASAMLYISVDRGVLLFAITGLLALTLPLFMKKEYGNYVVKSRGYLHNLSDTWAVLIGMTIGLFSPILFIGLDGFTHFIVLTFHDIPAYAGLLVSMPFPDLFSSSYQIWGPVFISIAAILLFVRLYTLKKGKPTMNLLIPYGFMLIFSVICIKMGTNRIDINKMATVTSSLFLVTVLLVSLGVHTYINQKNSRRQIGLILLLSSLSLVVFARLGMPNIIKQPTYTRSQLKSYLLTPKLADSYWLSPEMSAVTTIIRHSTDKSDYIYAFTSDPMYYYLTDRKNPSRFYINWYNDPQPYTDETLRNLKRLKPKIIIYHEKTWMDAPDNVSMEQRLPEINSWIKQNYPYEKIVGNTMLLSNKPW